MNVRALRPAIAFLVLAGAASLARADGQTYELPKKDLWKVGDVVTTVSTSSKKQQVKVSMPDGTVIKDTTTNESVAATRVVKVVEVDADGRASKRIVFLKAWSRDEDGAADASLAGAVIETTGHAATRAWKFVGKAPEATDAAKSWLDEHYGADADDKDEKGHEAFAPKKPLAVGESWDIDLAPLIDSAMKALPVDKANAKGKGTLEGVEDGMAHMALTISLPLAGMPGGPGAKPTAWTRGGTLQMDVKGFAPIDGRPLHGDMKMTTSLDGDSTAETPQGTFGVTLKIDGTQEDKTSPGGEIPETK